MAPGGSGAYQIQASAFESALQENSDQMAFVVGAAFEIVDRVGGLRQRFGGFGELLLDLRPWRR
jgi:outer membrane phospholipase A